MRGVLVVVAALLGRDALAAPQSYRYVARGSGSKSAVSKSCGEAAMRMRDHFESLTIDYVPGIGATVNGIPWRMMPPRFGGLVAESPLSTTKRKVQVLFEPPPHPGSVKVAIQVFEPMASGGNRCMDSELLDGRIVR
ncbi:MAG: hypothetical protein QM831_08525 [Kofleriaceae bacterium]